MVVSMMVSIPPKFAPQTLTTETLTIPPIRTSENGMDAPAGLLEDTGAGHVPTSEELLAICRILLADTLEDLGETLFDESKHAEADSETTGSEPAVSEPAANRDPPARFVLPVMTESSTENERRRNTHNARQRAARTRARAKARNTR